MTLQDASSIKRDIETQIATQPPKKKAEVSKITDEQLEGLVKVGQNYKEMIQGLGWLQLMTWIDREGSATKVLTAHKNGKTEQKMNEIQAYLNLRIAVSNDIAAGDRAKEILLKRKQGDKKK